MDSALAAVPPQAQACCLAHIKVRGLVGWPSPPPPPTRPGPRPPYPPACCCRGRAQGRGRGGGGGGGGQSQQRLSRRAAVPCFCMSASACGPPPGFPIPCLPAVPVVHTCMHMRGNKRVACHQRRRPLTPSARRVLNVGVARYRSSTAYNGTSQGHMQYPSAHVRAPTSPPPPSLLPAPRSPSPAATTCPTPGPA